MNHEAFERLAEEAFAVGEPGPARDRIESLAAGDPELQRCGEDLLAASGALAGAGLEPLPAGLHEALISAIPAGGMASGGRMSWLTFITAAIQVRPAFALGGAVAAGFAIGAIGIGALMGGLRESRELAPGTAASLAPMPALVATTTLEQGGARLELTSRRTDAGIIVRLVSRDATPATLTLAWDPATLRFAAVRWEGADAPSFEPAPGRAVLRLPSAAGSELTFDGIVTGDRPVRVTLSAAGSDREVNLCLPR